jgi:hypothetical protein
MADNIDEQIAEEPNPFDACNPEDIADKERAVKALKAKKLRVVESIMSNEDGRAWMFDLLGTNCHTFSDNLMYDTDSRNGRFEGERAVGLRLFTEIMEAAPEMFWKMVCEARERERK